MKHVAPDKRSSVRERLESFEKNNRWGLRTLVFGGTIMIVARMLQEIFEGVIPPFVTLLNFAAYFAILIGFLALCVNMEKKRTSSVFVFATMVLTVEVVCFFLLGMPAKEDKEFFVAAPGHIASEMGNVPYPDSVYHNIKIVGSDTSYDVHSTIDSNWKRFTPGHDASKEKHALFFGCSIAFGEGLEDDQTLPYYFQQASEKYNAYNFAISGHGTNHMLARLQTQDLTEQVSEEDGVAFYVFFWDHIYRSIGAMSRYTSWAHDGPYYILEDDALVRKGSFKTGRFVSKIYEAVYQLSMLKYFEIDFPLSLREDHYSLMCKMIEKSKEIYTEEFGNTDFYVLIYPSYDGPPGWNFNTFKEKLNALDIKYIDLFDHIAYGPEYTFVGDGHPNSMTSELIGNELRRQLAGLSN